MKRHHPLVIAALAGLAVLAAAFAPVVWHGFGGGVLRAPATGLAPPWQIEVEPDGATRAFGLRLPTSTLADAERLWGDELQVALVGRGEEAGALEAHLEGWQGGGVRGRLTLAFAADPARLVAWRRRSPHQRAVDAQAWRRALDRADREEARRLRVVGASFVPTARVDVQTLRARFGEPAEVMGGDSDTEHWLYPRKGLVLSFDRSGRLVVQVALPAEFGPRLRAPLAAGVAASRPRP